MTTPAPVATPAAISIVLVHGAFVDASGWRDVYDRLAAAGYEVLVVQNATLTLEGDVAATRRVIDLAKHPVVLVGHSYGGAVITAAGDHPKVSRLVYIAAFSPDVGESVFDLATTPVSGFDAPPLLPPSEGVILVDAGAFPSVFAADIDPSTSRFMAAAQTPWGLGAVEAKITNAAWRTKPAHYLVATQDRMIAPAAQRSMATRAQATSVEIESSHAVMLSHPGAVADVIAGAARVAANADEFA